MIICENGKMIEVADTEIVEEITGTPKADKVTALIEGLSNATTISQIRNIAKSILENTDESGE